MSYEQTFESIEDYIARTKKWESEHPKKEQTFEEQILIEHNSRIQRENWEWHCKQVRGEYIYVNFCVWCNAFNDCKGKNDAKLFAKFLKQENIELTFWQRKHLAEKYFGYKYEYDYAKGEWEIKKINNESDNGD